MNDIKNVNLALSLTIDRKKKIVWLRS